MPQWTDKQQEVIDTRNRNILVSAAAGSGKTAVLVERIIQLLTDEAHPMNINELLVVTFTRAAALEMKERVREALEEIVVAQPDNVHIQKQLSLMNTAQITTIDSFCSSVVRENFEKVDLDPDFRIGDDGEIALIKTDILEEMLSEYYESANEEFMELIEQYKASKADERVIDLIEELYKASESHENPEKWIASCIDNYSVTTVEVLEQTTWIQKNLERARNVLTDLCDKAEEAVQICESPGGPKNYTKVLQEIKNACELASTKQTYIGMKNAIGDYKFPGLPKKSEAEDVEKENLVKTLKTQITKDCDKIVKTYFSYAPEEILEEIQGTRKQVETVIQLTLEFMKRFREKKQEKGIMGFSDQEHYALKILTSEDADGNLVPSDIAKRMSKQYKEIMIDEYQDSNVVQEAILTSIAKGNGIDNVFMVGDVKQSIYRFRLANPNLFLEKYDTYSDKKEDTHYKIILDKNFRSREEVIESVNFIFDTIMCKHTGGIEYIDNNRLVCGAKYCDLPEDQSNATEVILFDGDRQFEMEQIAKRIKEIVDPKIGMKVQGKDGKLRLAKYSDIVILLRSIAGISNLYVDVLEKYGIPAYTETKTGFYDAKEVLTILNFLNILDNPRQDIPLAATLLSPMFQFTENELAEIRIVDEQDELYDALKVYLQDGDEEEIQAKIQKFFEVYGKLRDTVPYMTVYALIDEILHIGGYEYYIRALPAGMRRIKNVELLKEKAVAYEQTSYSGLFNFVRYIEKLKVMQEEGEALSVDESDNIVRIMSIHKSKGLQFPIVFLANTTSQFRAESDAIAIHEKYGIGMDYVNHELKVQNKSLIKNTIRNEITNENKAELLRLLYVALTRAQEKLIITGATKKIDTLLDKIKGYRKKRNVQASHLEIINGNNFMDWIFLAVSRNHATDALGVDVPSGNLDLYEKEAHIETNSITAEGPEELLEEYVELTQEQNEKEELLKIDKNQVFDPVAKQILEKNLSWEYPNTEDIKITTKASVTEIKRQAMQEYDEQQDGVELFKEEIKEMIPNFAKDEEQLQEKITGANRGTAYHRVFELMDLHLPEYTVESVTQMMQQLLLKGQIDETTFGVVKVEDMIRFSKTRLFERMKEADKRGELFREQKFLLGKKACEINPKTTSEELVIIQGIIDVCFIEDGCYYVVDYKTDKVASLEELYERYHVQLDYYKEAIMQITEKPVAEKIIYSVTLGEELSF